MFHYMKLNTEPFSKIKSGSKTFELSLNDEKRKLISIGDNIEFTCICGSGNKLLTKVINLYYYKSFDELYNDLPLDKCGYDENNILYASPKDMELYYSKDKQQLYGVVAIELELLEL